MVLSFQDIYGWSMDEIVSRVGMKNSCRLCEGIVQLSWYVLFLEIMLQVSILYYLLTLIKSQGFIGWEGFFVVGKPYLLHIGTYCGVFRRQALDRGAAILNANKVTAAIGVVLHVIFSVCFCFCFSV